MNSLVTIDSFKSNKDYEGKVILNLDNISNIEFSLEYDGFYTINLTLVNGNTPAYEIKTKDYNKIIKLAKVEQ